MNRKRSKRKSSSAGDRPRAVPRGDLHDGEPSDASPSRLARVPSGTARGLLSLWLSFHGAAVFLSFTGVVEPSAIHARLNALFHPYLRPPHFSADDRPVYLTYGEAGEGPHQFQVTSATINDLEKIDSYDWRSIGPERAAGLAASDRLARWLSTAAMLAENDQPGLVAQLLLPAVRNDEEIAAIRILRQTTDLSDVNENPESIYVGKVVRGSDPVSIIQLNPTSLSSKVRPHEGSNNE